MAQCEVCGRHPAKRMSFKAHQGFVVFRRESEISGVYCRDHALAAYAVARGATLKGMWFSTSSLLFGTFRSLWDAAKLLDLPPDVKDEPWMLHKADCPSCGHSHFTTAGPVKCEKCDVAFVIASCMDCRTIHVVRTSEPFDTISVLNCRNCRSRTQAQHAVENAPSILVAKALAEVAAKVAKADGDIDPRERRAFTAAIEHVFEFQKATLECLGQYFDRCLEDGAIGIFRSCVENCQPQILRLILSVAASVASADGKVSEIEVAILIRFADAMGIDSSYFQTDAGASRENNSNEPVDSWWMVLRVSQEATIDQATAAYHKLARQFHPDLWRNAPEGEATRAAERMKAVNAAFSEARDYITASKTTRRSAEQEATESRARQSREKAETERRAREERARADEAEAKRIAELERQVKELAREKAETERRAREARDRAKEAEATRIAELERQVKELAREKAEIERRAREERARADEAEAKRVADLERQAKEFIREQGVAEWRAHEERARAEEIEAKRIAELERQAKELAREKGVAEWLAHEERARAEETRNDLPTGCEGRHPARRFIKVCGIAILFVSGLACGFFWKNPDLTPLERFSTGGSSGPGDINTQLLLPRGGIDQEPDMKGTPADGWLDLATLENDGPVRITPMLPNFTFRSDAPLAAKEAHGRAIERCNQSQWNSAVDEFSTAIALYPKYQSAYWNRGGAHNQLQEYQFAWDDCSKAIELNPKSSPAYGHRAWANLGLNRLSAALLDADKALALERGNGWAQFYRAVAIEMSHLDAHRPTEVIDEYRKALVMLDRIEFRRLDVEMREPLRKMRHRTQSAALH